MQVEPCPKRDGTLSKGRPWKTAQRPENFRSLGKTKNAYVMLCYFQVGTITSKNPAGQRLHSEISATNWRQPLRSIPADSLHRCPPPQSADKQTVKSEDTQKDAKPRNPARRVLRGGSHRRWRCRLRSLGGFHAGCRVRPQSGRRHAFHHNSARNGQDCRHHCARSKVIRLSFVGLFACRCGAATATTTSNIGIQRDIRDVPTITITDIQSKIMLRYEISACASGRTIPIAKLIGASWRRRLRASGCCRRAAQFYRRGSRCRRRGRRRCRRWGWSCSVRAF